MADVHQMREISSPPQRGVGMERASFTAPESRAEREVTTFSGRYESELLPKEAEQRQVVTQFRDPRRMETPLEGEVTRFNRNEPSKEPKLTEEVDRWSYPTGTESRTERQVTTFSGREPSMETEERRLRSEEVNEWKYPRTEPGGERGPISEVRHGGGVGHRMTHRREMTMTMDCPICGNVIYGSDDDDLSDELRFHFKERHGLRRR